jgi:predicted ATPase
MAELLEHARSAGATTLSARCYEGETDLAYAPVIQLLRGAVDNLQRSGALERISPRDLTELARLLPEVDASAPPSSGETAGAQTMFMEGISHVLLAAGEGRPLILALDDLHWSDAASLECLAYLLRRLEGCRVGVVLTWRGEDLPAAHVLRRVIAEAQRAGSATMLQLGRLDREAVIRLVEAVSPEQFSNLGDRLFAETEGLPLFLGEYLRAIAGGSLDMSLPQLEGDLVPAMWASWPAGVRDLLSSRLVVVSESGWQFLAAAAVLGRSFDFDLLRETSGRDEEMAVSALEELVVCL